MTKTINIAGNQPEKKQASSKRRSLNTCSRACVTAIVGGRPFLHELVQGPQQASECSLAQNQHLALFLGNNACRSWGVLQQSQFSEISLWLVREDLTTVLSRCSGSCFQNKELGPWITLPDDLLPGLKGSNLQGVCKLGNLIYCQALQQRHLLQE